MTDPGPSDAALRARADRIVIDALEVESSARAALIGERCADEASLRALVESLLAQVHLLDDFLVEPIADVRFADFPGDEPREGDLVGRRRVPCRIVREIVRRGIGLAQEGGCDDGVRAPPKTTERGMESEAIVGRFRTTGRSSPRSTIRTSRG